MNLTYAAQMADVLTSIFTILTLFYLALQIRASSASQRAESRRAAVAENSAYLNHLVENVDVARIWRLGLNDVNELNADEQIQFFSLFGLMLDSEIQRFTEHSLHILSDEEFWGNDQRSVFVAWLDSSGGLLFWKMHKNIVQEDFRQHIDRELQKRAESRRAADSPESDSTSN